MKAQTLLAALIVATIVGGCQAVKEIDGNIAKTIRQSGKQFVQQKLDEWIDLAGAEVQWNHVPEKYRRQGVARALLGKNRSGHSAFFGGCEPSLRFSYPRSRESINSHKELFEFAISLGWFVAGCDGNSELERYQIEHEAAKWVLVRWREAELRRTQFQRAFMFCGLDHEVRRYKQHNPGRPIDADVLNFMKDNPIPTGWECNP